MGEGGAVHVFRPPVLHPSLLMSFWTVKLHSEHFLSDFSASLTDEAARGAGTSSEPLVTDWWKTLECQWVRGSLRCISISDSICVLLSAEAVTNAVNIIWETESVQKSCYCFRKLIKPLLAAELMYALRGFMCQMLLCWEVLVAVWCHGDRKWCRQVLFGTVSFL